MFSISAKEKRREDLVDALAVSTPSESEPSSSCLESEFVLLPLEDPFSEPALELCESKPEGAEEEEAEESAPKLAEEDSEVVLLSDDETEEESSALEEEVAEAELSALDEALELEVS
ncbi:Carboxypeptidase regulatory-like domain-containing protein [Balamuthia mandrillaris]